jgi:AcrR family transcriptional regulator
MTDRPCPVRRCRASICLAHPVDGCRTTVAGTPVVVGTGRDLGVLVLILLTLIPIGVTLTSINTKRKYSSAVRQAQAAATRRRIVDAAQELFVDPSHEFTLERVAEDADVSVQTILRAFGNKERLILETIGTFRSSEVPVVVDPVPSPAEAVTVLFDDYERIGDRVIRMLAEEHRIPGFTEAATSGRTMHRAWVEANFAPQLSDLRGRQRTGLLLALVAATDVYLWKLLRRDLGLDRREAESTVVRLVEGALSTGKER